MDTSLVIAFSLSVVVLVAVGVVTAVHRKQTQAERRKKVIANGTALLTEIDKLMVDLVEIGPSRDLWQPLVVRREQLAAAMREEMPTVPDAPYNEASILFDNMLNLAPDGLPALNRIVKILKRTGRYLAKLARYKVISPAEHQRLTNQLASTAVRIQVNAQERWARDETDWVAARSHLRNAQETLLRSLHLDDQFQERITALKAKEIRLAPPPGADAPSAAAPSP